MAQGERYYGGLVFFDDSVHELDGYCRVVSSTLEDYGYAVDRQSILPDGQARITSSMIAVRLKLGTHNDQPRLTLAVVTTGSSVVGPDEAKLVLLAAICRIIEIHPAQYIEWLDPRTVLSSGKFLGAVTKISPRRIRSRQEVLDADDTRFSPVDETAQTISCRYDEICSGPGTNAAASGQADESDALAQAFRTSDDVHDGVTIDAEDDAESDIRRLAVWGMTGVVACLSGPVGLSMAAVNLMRGEDFRLNTHVLALTGFLGAVTSTGAMAQVVAVLPI